MTKRKQEEKLEQEAIHLGISYINALDLKNSTPFTAKEYLVDLEYILRKIRKIRFDC